jgi:hypothetical protein
MTEKEQENRVLHDSLNKALKASFEENRKLKAQLEQVQAELLTSQGLRSCMDAYTNVDTAASAEMRQGASNLLLCAELCAASRKRRHGSDHKAAGAADAADAASAAAGAAEDVDTEPSVKKKKRFLHGAQTTEIGVFDAFCGLEPFLGLASWKFADQEAYDTFIGVQQGALETLRKLGFSQSNPEQTISEFRFSWDPFKALVNVYALKTNWKLDTAVKSHVLSLKKSLGGKEQAQKYFDECFVQTNECKPVATACKLFPFAPSEGKNNVHGNNGCALPVERMREIVQINQTLARMMLNGKVLEACSWKLSERLKEQVRQSWEADSGRAPGLNALNDNLKQIALGRQGAPLLGSPRAGLPGHPPRPRGPCAPRPRAPARLAKCQRSPPAHCPARSAH